MIIRDSVSSDGIDDGVGSGIFIHEQFWLGIFVGVILTLFVIGIIKLIQIGIKDYNEYKKNKK